MTTHPVTGRPVTSAHTGTNADLIREVCRLYAPKGSVIADVTYSTGRFWRKTDTSAYRMLPSDLHPAAAGVIAADFTALPYKSGSVDVVVLDPPYVHSPGRRADTGQYVATSTRYNSTATIDAHYHADIMALYEAGLAEALRVLNPDGGTCWVKCKDSVQREIQQWAHIQVYQRALAAGFAARDLFVLTGPTVPDRWPGRQHHARKTHSYLWVFERPDDRRAKLLARTPPKGPPRHVSARRKKVAALLAAGRSQRQIAAALGVSQSTVRDDAARLRARKAR